MNEEFSRRLVVIGRFAGLFIIGILCAAFLSFLTAPRRDSLRQKEAQRVIDEYTLQNEMPKALVGGEIRLARQPKNISVYPIMDAASPLEISGYTAVSVVNGISGPVLPVFWAPIDARSADQIALCGFAGMRDFSYEAPYEIGFSDSAVGQYKSRLYLLFKGGER